MTATNSGATGMRNTSTTAHAPGSKSGSSTTSSHTSAEAPEKPKKQIFRIFSQKGKQSAHEFLDDIQVSEDRPWVVTLQPWEEKRSELQNRYLWGWLYKNIAQQLEAAGITIALDDGREYPYNADMLHEIFKDRFLCYDTIACRGRERKLCYSTTQLLKKPKEGEEQRSFSGYVTQIKQFIYQVWEIHIPPTYNEDYRSLEREMENYR